MNFQKSSFEETLDKHVVIPGRCVGCRACVITCPFHCLTFREGKPQLVIECEQCGVCATSCQNYQVSLNQLDQFTFDRIRDFQEVFGVYRKLFLARAVDQTLLATGQDGGVVTALLSFALKNRLIDGAIISTQTSTKPFFPSPQLVSDNDLLKASVGSRYSYSNNLCALVEGLRQNKKALAFVGTPCHIRAVRTLQKSGSKLTKNLRYVFGLFCFTCFTYDGLMKKYLHETLGFNLDEITKINIKQKNLLVYDHAKCHVFPLTHVTKYVRKACKSCIDFSSEFADLSFGGLGLVGATVVIIRTERGEQLFSQAQKERVIHAWPLPIASIRTLTALSAKKRSK